MNTNDLAKQNNLSDNEIVILNEIILRINKGIYKIPIREVANAAYVSTTSIVRLSKKLGYEGYSEMLYGLKIECTNTVEYNVKETIRSVLIIENSLAIVDELINDILSLKYQRIHVIGIGYSGYVADYLRDKLLEMEYFVTTKSPLDFEEEKSILVLFVSESGETNDLIFIEERCKQKDCKIYALTTNEKSTLCKNTENNIIIKSGRKRINKFPDYFIGNSINLIESILAILQASKREEKND